MHFICFPGIEYCFLSFAPDRITPAVKQSLESIAQSETYGVGRSIESGEAIEGRAMCTDAMKVSRKRIFRVRMPP